jgi:hypothetical protein
MIFRAAMVVSAAPGNVFSFHFTVSLIMNLHHCFLLFVKLNLFMTKFLHVNTGQWTRNKDILWSWEFRCINMCQFLRKFHYNFCTIKKKSKMSTIVLVTLLIKFIVIKFILWTSLTNLFHTHMYVRLSFIASDFTGHWCCFKLVPNERWGLAKDMHVPCSQLSAVICDVLFHLIDAAIYNSHSMARTRRNSFCQHSAYVNAVTYSGSVANKSNQQC